MSQKIGHRGAAGTAIENSLKAFRRAIELGATGIEFDVRRAAVDNLVVFHDPTVDRVTFGNGPLLGFLFPHRLPRLKDGQGIPTPWEVIQEFGGKVELHIEVKEEGIMERIARMVELRQLEESCIISAFDENENEPGDSSNWLELLWVQKRTPRLKIALLAEKWENAIRAVALARAYPSRIYAINPSGEIITPSLVGMAHGAGSRVFVWTVDEPEEIARIKAMHVDGIISNYPDRL
ncbi:MAG: glycerophosphodiester phosphodiesterase [Candidatus Sungbacteria bacterium]|nr:glycerophosphodiester phosphodiesterase [Candidatus Sungbacteria bacterium]